MNKIAFYYFGIFYWLFEMGEHAPSRWASHWKAYILMTILEIWTLFSIFYYVSKTNDIIVDLSVKQVAFPFIIIFLIKIYYVFEKDDKWIEYVDYYRALSKEDRRKSLIITITLLLICILNIIFSIVYLSSSK